MATGGYSPIATITATPVAITVFCFAFMPVGRRWLLLFLEEAIKSVAGVAGIAWRIERYLRLPVPETWRHTGGCVARYRKTRSKECTLIRLIFDWNPYRDRLQALKASRGLELRALLATVELRVTFGTSPSEIDVVRQGCRATVTPRCRHRLNQPRQARTGYIDRGAWSGLLRPVFAAAFEFPVGIHVARLSVLSVAVHEASTTP